MLDGNAFFMYRNLLISEVVGVGKSVYEYLISLYNGSVVKVMINANNITESEQYFIRRFTLSSIRKHKENKMGLGCYYVYDEVLDMVSRPAFMSVVCRKVY